MYCLDLKFGEEVFMQAYKAIRQIDDELHGEVNIEVYEKRLAGIMDSEKIESSLYLFLVLKKLEDGVVSVDTS